jgi:hypothetical protein
MLARFRYVAPVCLFVVVCSATVVLAQSESDIKTMDKARSIYLTGPIPSSISCEVGLDWDGFFQRMKIEQTDDAKARLDKLKNVKISVVSRDANHTDVKVEGAEALSNGVSDGLRQQLQGFFQVYWSLAYGRMIAKKADKYELTTVPEGYLVKTVSSTTKTAIEMNKAYVITRTTVDLPGMSAVAKPGFKPGEDGLLRLRSLDETIDMGSTKMVVNMNFDYQKVGVYDIPLHMNMGLAGSFSFDYTLSGCEVKGASDAAPAAK